MRATGYVRFESALRERLGREGFAPVGERFPLAGYELAMLGYRALVRTRARRSWVVAAVQGDGLVRDQLRILSDQFYNALVREAGELRRSPTLLRGVCIFVYERVAADNLADFLLERVRPRTPFTVIRSLPWIYDLETTRLRRPWLTRRPFPGRLLDECTAAATAATPSAPGDLRGEGDRRR